MIAAIVLAAGRSERMGRPKALLPIGETNFAGAIVRSARAGGVDVVRLVVGHEAKRIRDGVNLSDGEVVENERYADGMLSSVRAGIRALPPSCEAFLLWPVDHPWVTGGTVAAILRARAAGRGRIVVPTHRSRRGHPVLFDASLAAELLDAPDEVGARAVVHARAGEVVEVEVGDPGVIADIDTPEQHDAGRRLGRAP